ncbi:MAG: tRNA (guanosine(46)-N7)-methyltransferase TrmB [Gammaproteobacteria bacterium]|nr:tRNA (guanosine(46)-N7)-methyltransferase TrmB [Gammaproteobacteria bacterium]
MTHNKKALDSYKKRPIRSFVQRTGRMTEGQKRAFDLLWEKYGIDYQAAQLDIIKVFGRDHKRTLEIGFGNGTSLATTAAKFPDIDFIGIEVHEPGVGRCMINAEEKKLKNLKFFCHDAIEILRDQFPNNSVDTINLFFPDPWHKKRHHKRRIVQAEFIATLSSKLHSGGIFHVATDWPPYAEHIHEVMAEQKSLQAVEGNIPWRPETRFENRGVKLGHKIWEQIYVKV